MRRRLHKRLWASDGDPGPLAWLIASVSLVLPVAGLTFCLFGGARLIRSGGEDGWTLLAGGAVLLVADIVIDFVWAHPGVSESDQPDLNRRAAQIEGRIVTVAETIGGGRGKVRVGDTLWAAEGPDMSAGRLVRIVSTKGVVLVVEPVDT